MNLVTAILGLVTAIVTFAAEIVGLVRQSERGNPEAGDKQDRGGTGDK